MIYNIINPSDPYTIAADDFEVAAVACFVLGEGAYAFEPFGAWAWEAPRVPAFLMTGSDEWCLKTFGCNAFDLAQRVLGTKMQALADCFDSVLIGDCAARKAFEKSTAGLDLAKTMALKRERHEQMVSSLNDIGARAYRLAAHLRGEQVAA